MIKEDSEEAKKEYLLKTKALKFIALKNHKYYMNYNSNYSTELVQDSPYL